jgi:hypothetical protein
MLVNNIITELPPVILFEGCLFKFSISHNNKSLILSYDLKGVFSTSKHYKLFKKLDGYWENRFIPCPDGFCCTYLFSKDEIRSLIDLNNAVDECLSFLNKNNVHLI